MEALGADPGVAVSSLSEDAGKVCGGAAVEKGQWGDSEDGAAALHAHGLGPGPGGPDLVAPSWAFWALGASGPRRTCVEVTAPFLLALVCLL